MLKVLRAQQKLIKSCSRWYLRGTITSWVSQNVSSASIPRYSVHVCAQLKAWTTPCITWTGKVASESMFEFKILLMGNRNEFSHFNASTLKNKCIEIAEKCSEHLTSSQQNWLLKKLIVLPLVLFNSKGLVSSGLLKQHSQVLKMG